MAESQAYTTSVQKLIQDCQAINQMLTEWTQSLPEEWTFDNQNLTDQSLWDTHSGRDDLSYNGLKHVYPSLEVAVTWNRYRGSRLVCNSIILKAMSHCFFMKLEDAREEDLSDRKTVESNSKALVDDICASIPIHFDKTGSVALERPTESLEAEANTITG